MAEHALEEAYALSAHAVARVLGGATLTRTLAEVIPPRAVASLRGAVTDLAATTLRAYGVPQLLARTLLTRPVTDTVLVALLYVTLVDLRANRERAYVIVDQAVRATERLGRQPAKGLVNAILRNYLRRADALEAAIARDGTARHRFPTWWTEALRRAAPTQWEAVLAVADTPPPLTLRVNRRRTTREAALDRLVTSGIAAEPIGAIGIHVLEPVPVDRLPGFASGEVSVQDAGAQLAAPLLDLVDGQRVLDACAAPGGKTGHILETAAVALTALDSDAARARRIGENLERLGLRARVQTGDAATLESWWDGVPFDRILADVPCSASGVVRRHPDIKWLRRKSDVAGFRRTQSAILDALWRALRPGGKLLYSTCSVFAAENEEQADAFGARHDDAVRVPLAGAGLDLRPSSGDARPPATGRLLPDPLHDGFYYALFARK